MKDKTRKHDENAKNKDEISCNKDEISVKIKVKFHVTFKMKFHVAIRENVTSLSRLNFRTRFDEKMKSVFFFIF